MPADGDPTAPDTIVLIHGFWVTPRSWRNGSYYQGKGYPGRSAYPGFEVEVEALRADPTPIENLTVQGVVDHLTEVLGALGRPPILMGHSAGGVFTVAAGPRLRRGRRRVGLGPTEGVPVVPLSQLKSTFPALRTVGRKKAAGFTFAQWHYAFCNTFPGSARGQLYERYHIPPRCGSCGAAPWPPWSLATRTPSSTITTTSRRRCCSSPAPTTTSCRPRCSAPMPSTTSRTRSPRSRSSRAAPAAVPRRLAGGGRLRPGRPSNTRSAARDDRGHPDPSAGRRCCSRSR